MITLISTLATLMGAIFTAVGLLIVISLMCSYLGFISSGKSWQHGLTITLGVPNAYLLLREVGYFVSIDGQPTLHHVAYMLIGTAPYTISVGLALLLLDGVPRVLGRTGALDSERGKQSFWILVLIGTVLGFATLGDDIWKEIIRVDCGTMTADARDRYPECRKM